MARTATQSQVPISGLVRFVGNLMAGAVTALVFYAEYLSLGATLGSSVPGAGASSAAIGTLLVMGAVWMCCLSALLWRLPMPLLSGPRAASLLLLIIGLDWVKTHATDITSLPHTAVLAMALMLVIGVAVQLLGFFKNVQFFVANADKWVTRGFLFVTAVGIMGQMVKNQLAGCLLFDFWPAAVVFGLSLGLGTAWMKLCQHHLSLKRLTVLSMFIGIGVGWAGYVLLLPAATSATGCGTLGAAGLRWETLSERIPGATELPAAWRGLTLVNWLVVLAIGSILGMVQLIETLTALETVPSTRAQPALWRRYIAAAVTANLLSAPFGMANSSLSGSRSVAALEAQGNSGMTVLVHGIVLALLTSFATGFISRTPVLAIAVALALVAVQMIDEATQTQVWEPGYRNGATPGDVYSTWLFWMVLLAGFLSGQAIVGLLAGCVVMVLKRKLKNRQAAQ